MSGLTSVTLPILRVAIYSPLRRTFDYLPLCSSGDGLTTTQWQPGQRVRVPFGSRQLVGVIVDLVKEAAVSYDKLKTVIASIDSHPLLSSRQMRLYRWASDYYHHPIGEVILGSLPKLLRQGRDLSEDPGAAELTLHPSPFSLNPAQTAAVTAIKAVGGFQVFCLQGVTGSGKTAVYLDSMEPIINDGRQVLVLVPEIALTPQTVQRFQQRFQVPMVSLHSELTDKTRLGAWSQAQSGYARIIIGTRSAVFVPMKNPGMIIIDETHDSSFKQQSGFRYSARDVAIKRAQIEDLTIVLGSATPSLETLMNVSQRRYHPLVLPDRAGSAKPPKIEVIDLRNKSLKTGLSQPLIDTIGQHLKRGQQVLLFLNRRGYAPTLLCHCCGWMVECARCDARMTLHKNPQRLYCHHCGGQTPVPSVCGGCGQAELSDIGVGTEQLELALQSLFPDEPVIRIDRDSTRRKGSLQVLLEQIYSGKVRLLIGTQMLSKGHHFPQLSLVAIVDADGGLYGTDFRAMERMAQLIVQVSGRAGREERLGEVVIQTHHPGHPLLQLLLEQGYVAFSRALLQERQLSQLPPYAYLALLRAEAIQKPRPLQFLQQIKQQLFLPESVAILGPIPAPMERRAGRYRAQLLLQSQDRLALQSTVRRLVYQCEQMRVSRTVRWSVDIDPQEML